MSDALEKLAEVAVNLGEAPKHKIELKEQPPEGYVHCACGKKFIPVGKVRIFNTKFVKGVVDTICDECWPDVQDLVPIVCIRCKAVVARVQPTRCPSGFEFQKDHPSHTNFCPNCNLQCKEEGKPSILIEKAMYEREFGTSTTKIIS